MFAVEKELRLAFNPTVVLLHCEVQRYTVHIVIAEIRTGQTGAKYRKLVLPLLVVLVLFTNDVDDDMSF